MSFAHRLKPAQLRLVLRIAEVGKLQEAADEVAMSQPAASRMLSDIETLVGAPLFNRHPKGMAATAVGRAIAHHARLILKGFDQLEDDVGKVIAGRSGTVRVGTVTGPAVGIVVPAIEAIRESVPDIEFTVEVGPSTSLVRGLDEGIFDFVIARMPPDHDSRNYRIYPARNEAVSLLVYHDHPQAGRDKVRLSDLSSYNWVIQERGTPIRAAVEEAFHIHGVPMPTQVLNSSSLLVALALLKQSTTISPQSHEVAELLTGSDLNLNVTRLNLTEDILVSPFFAIVRMHRPLSPIVERVIQEVLGRL